MKSWTRNFELKLWWSTHIASMGWDLLFPYDWKAVIDLKAYKSNPHFPRKLSRNHISQYLKCDLSYIFWQSLARLLSPPFPVGCCHFASPPILKYSEKLKVIKKYTIREEIRWLDNYISWGFFLTEFCGWNVEFDLQTDWGWYPGEF